MEEDPDRELEHYVWQHKDESLRQIQEGMEKEFDRTKSTKWITPRRNADIHAEIEVDFPTEEEILDEGEEKDAPLKDKETEVKDDPEIIEMNRQMRCVEKERKHVAGMILLKEATLKLALTKQNVKTVEELDDNISAFKRALRRDKKLIRRLKDKLEKAMELDPDYYPDTICSDCDGRFFWKGNNNWIECCVCGQEFELKKIK